MDGGSLNMRGLVGAEPQVLLRRGNMVFLSGVSTNPHLSLLLGDADGASRPSCTFGLVSWMARLMES